MHEEDKRGGGGSGLGWGRVFGGGAGEWSGRPAMARPRGGGRRSSGAAERARWNRGGRVWASAEKGKWVGPNGIEDFFYLFKRK
jgi:hypothetical protein